MGCLSPVRIMLAGLEAGGGAGDMGRYVAQTLASDARFSQVVIADMNVSSARQLAADIGGAVSARRVDAGDDESLDDVLGDSDAVVSCVEPFYRFGVPVLPPVF